MARKSRAAAPSTVSEAKIAKLFDQIRAGIRKSELTDSELQALIDQSGFPKMLVDLLVSDARKIRALKDSSTLPFSSVRPRLQKNFLTFEDLIKRGNYSVLQGSKLEEIRGQKVGEENSLTCLHPLLVYGSGEQILNAFGKRMATLTDLLNFGARYLEPFGWPGIAILWGDDNREFVWNATLSSAQKGRREFGIARSLKFAGGWDGGTRLLLRQMGLVDSFIFDGQISAGNFDWVEGFASAPQFIKGQLPYAPTGDVISYMPVAGDSSALTGDMTPASLYARFWYQMVDLSEFLRHVGQRDLSSIPYSTVWRDEKGDYWQASACSRENHRRLVIDRIKPLTALHRGSFCLLLKK